MKKKKKTDALTASWEAFSKTGKINYYLFYKNLKDEG